jgi:DNA replication initiation complex subunit (GINS family)
LDYEILLQKWREMVGKKGVYGSLIDEEFIEEGKKFLSELKSIQEKKVSELKNVLSEAMYLRAKFMLEELLKLEKKEKIWQGGGEGGEEREEEEKIEYKIEGKQEEEFSKGFPFQEVSKEEHLLLKEYITVRILKDLPSVVGIVGEKLHVFGPFKNEDIVILPKKVAEAFIENKVASPIQMEGLNIKKEEI